MGIFSNVRPGSPHPGTFADLPQDMDAWGCNNFQIYFSRNKRKEGAVRAFEIVGNDFDRLGTFADARWCVYNCGWINFWKREGAEAGVKVEGGNLITNLSCGAAAATEAVGKGVRVAGVLATVAGLGFLFNEARKRFKK